MAKYGFVSDNIDLDGQNYLTMTMNDGATVYADTDTSITINVKDSDGDADTAYNGSTVRITVWDSTTSLAVNVRTGSDTMAASTTGTISSSSVTITDLEIDCESLAGNALYVNAEILSGGSSIAPKVYGNSGVTAAANAIAIVFTVDPFSVVRNSNFTYTVTANNGYGTVTSETGSVTVTLVGADANDVFNSTSATTKSVSLTSGTATVVDKIITGTGAEAGITLTGALSGYSTGSTGTFNVIVLENYVQWRSGVYDVSFATAHTNCDADTVPTDSSSNSEGIMDTFSGAAALFRGGPHYSGVSDLGTVNMAWTASSDAQTVNFQIRVAHTVPSSGADYKAGTLVETVTGSASGTATYSLPASKDDIWIWAIAEADTNNTGYPSLSPDFTAHLSFGVVTIS